MSYYTPMSGTRNESTEMREFNQAESHGIDVQDVGTTTNPMIHQTEALKARIFHGANRVEFTFFGRAKSSNQSYTPETFGKREREDMRALAEINNVLTPR